MTEITYAVVTEYGVEYRSFEAPDEIAEWMTELQQDYIEAMDLLAVVMDEVYKSV